MSLPVVMLMGPTAVGKTEVALHIAETFPVEIVSVDSANVYLGMDIGTAKPDVIMRQSIRHHLIDCIDPTESYSAARFRHDALEIIDAIRSRGKIPLLVGGTFLYFKVLQEGIHTLPDSDREVRMMIENEAKLLGWPAMHARLQSIDPVTAARLNVHDGQRIGRALEIYVQSGQSMSVWLAKPKFVVPDFPVLRIALEPSDRGHLHDRIANRFRKMLASGLVNEVERLRQTYVLKESMPSMRCVGYRQVWKYLEGFIGKNELEESGIAATRQLARRQLTWLRSMDQVNRVNCFAEDLGKDVCKLVQKAVENA
ncbi:MAG: tRNA (adenosine(37)-N6)-dimethylallyltransferase MiaA [Pseudomonadota bacterium]|nr:tRNA (adenosine(37)-N6)-dimethylallyltransferase MiaA [Pseudomonadota bacterium]